MTHINCPKSVIINPELEQEATTQNNSLKAVCPRCGAKLYIEFNVKEDVQTPV
jgi:hypothetical protein